ncbi:hypothetical protein HJG60_011028 [Phyllostomus discolor]|uniref:Uncharacterized protein n=1 Tax=Phyllostomus discolor TaxID=89673 RepID=A0A834ECZ4_9CHIR|nr:hypothetical protein HJG60_011028 [Phyllostomus discolor]
MDGPFPAGDGQLTSPRASRPWLHRAIDRPGARQGTRAAFSSRGRLRGCFCFILLGFWGLLKEKKEKKEEERPSLCACPLRGQGTPASPPRWLPARVPPETCPASLGSGDPRWGRGSPASAAEQIDGPQTLKRDPSQRHFLHARVHKGRGGVESSTSPRFSVWLALSIK